jgi:hypothetical protein
MGKLFNNVFIEIVKDTDGKTKDLNILDTTNVNPIVEPNGDTIKYESTIPNPFTGETPSWTKSEIVWIKFGDRTAGYAPVDMRALWENLLLKSYVQRYVSWLWKTGQYRLIYNFNKASNQDIEDFLAYGRKIDSEFDIPAIVKGDVKTSLLRDMRETSSLVELLKYLDSQTLILLRVPPIDAGIPDASGRSNADAQANNIESTIGSFKKIVEDYINYDLFPKINKSTYLLAFSPINRFAIKQIVGIASELKTLGFSNEALNEFLGDQGIFFKTEPLFVEQPTDKVEAAFKNAGSNYRPKDFGVKNQPQEEVTTREDQIKKV